LTVSFCWFFASWTCHHLNLTYHHLKPQNTY
jgi:hypothetical protein